MKRRSFLTLIGGAAVAWPMGAGAQQRAMPVVGFLVAGTPETTADVEIAGFRKGLGEAGFVEGRNVAVEYYWNYDDPTRHPEAVVDLVRRRVDIIVASTARAALVAKSATMSIPIVFWAAADAIEIGLVTSLARPSGNVTGINSMSAELTTKRLGLLHELLPNAQRFGVLYQPTVPAAEQRVAIAKAAAASSDLALEVFTANTVREIDAAFAEAIQLRVEALLVLNGQFFISRRIQLVTLAVHHRMPVMYFERLFPQVGGLMSYVSSRKDECRQVGVYAGRILKGEKPADLPVLQPTKFELVINLQTARLIGLEVPPTVLALADEAIE